MAIEVVGPLRRTLPRDPHDPHPRRGDSEPARLPHRLPASVTARQPGRPTLRENLRGMPREAWVLFAGVFVNRLGTFVLPSITLYLTSRGYSVPQAGLGLAAYGLGAIGSQAAGGVLADRLGRRSTIALGMFGGAATTLSLVWIHGLGQIVGAVALLGFVAELFRPAPRALIAGPRSPGRGGAGVYAGRPLACGRPAGGG